MMITANKLFDREKKTTPTIMGSSSVVVSTRKIKPSSIRSLNENQGEDSTNVQKLKAIFTVLKEKSLIGIESFRENRRKRKEEKRNMREQMIEKSPIKNTPASTVKDVVTGNNIFSNISNFLLVLGGGILLNTFFKLENNFKIFEKEIPNITAGLNLFKDLASGVIDTFQGLFNLYDALFEFVGSIGEGLGFSPKDVDKVVGGLKRSLTMILQVSAGLLTFTAVAGSLVRGGIRKTIIKQINRLNLEEITRQRISRFLPFTTPEKFRRQLKVPKEKEINLDDVVASKKSLGLIQERVKNMRNKTTGLTAEQLDEIILKRRKEFRIKDDIDRPNMRLAGPLQMNLLPNEQLKRRSILDTLPPKGEIIGGPRAFDATRERLPRMTTPIKTFKSRGKNIKGILIPGKFTMTQQNFLSSFFKKNKIPIIGGLLDFAMNYFVLGYPIGEAAFRAAGASLLGGIFTIVGTGLGGPIGAIILGLIGGTAGDVIGGLLYDAIFSNSATDNAGVLQSYASYETDNTIINQTYIQPINLFA